MKRCMLFPSEKRFSKCRETKELNNSILWIFVFALTFQWPLVYGEKIPIIHVFMGYVA